MNIKRTRLESAKEKGSIKPGPPASLHWNKKKRVELISEIHLLKEQLESSYGIDPLTELPNRTNMLEKLRYEKCRFERNKRPFSLIMADIDNFAIIQEAYDAKTTNSILTQVGKFLNLNSRKQDVVSHWGGERFLFLLPETPLDGATVLIEKLCKKVATGEFSHPGQSIPITMSFRVGTYDDETMTIEDCILEVDGCLF